MEEALEDNKFNFRLENFEGPLDYLLHLIKQNKMEIENIQLALITEQYLESIANLQKLDLEKAGEFIEVAATLIEIKSKALLPKIVAYIEEEDSEALLLQRLQEYKLLKESSFKLKELENLGRYYKSPDDAANKYRVVIKDMSLDLLLDAFAKIMYRVNKAQEVVPPKEIAKEKFTIVEKIVTIKQNLLVHKRVMFSKLFEESTTRDEVITTFLALLELLKLQEIKVFQDTTFNDIEIVKVVS